MKKILIKIHLLMHLKNAEHFDLIEGIITFVDTLIAPFSKLTTLWAQFKTSFNEENLHYKQSQKQEGTLEIEEAHHQRSESYMAIVRTAEYFIYSKVENEKKAAELLRFLLDIYKSAHLKPYPECSALLTNLLEDLALQKYSEAITTLDLAEKIQDLQTDNDHFKELYRTRSIDQYLLQEEKLAMYRQETDEALINLGDAINAAYTNALLDNPLSQETKELGDIINIINSLIKKAEDVYARRVKSYYKGSTPADPDKPDPGPAKPYEFNVSLQIVDTGMDMKILDSNPATFAQEMVGKLEDGEVLMQVGEDSYFFTFKEYYRNEQEEVIGLTVNPPEGTGLIDPFSGTPVDEAIYIKGEHVLMKFTNIQLPAIID